MAESIIAGRLEEALYQTCLLLIEERTDILENIWIGAISRLGDAGGSINALTWYAVCKDIWAACSADGIRVKDALLCTGKLALLARQLYNTGAGLGGIGSTSVARLRSQVIGFFPETGVRLTLRGQETFARILPAREDERLFAERLLIGLSQLWDDIGTGQGEASAEASLDLRLAMEYLLRKRQIGIHCARVGQHVGQPDSSTPMWPYPSLEECDRGDVVWFLWGAWMAKYPWAEILWRLFSLNFKRGLRTERLGLIMGCRALLSLPPGMGSFARISSSTSNSSATSFWGENERAALAYIDEHSTTMWKEAVEAAGGGKKKTTASKKEKKTSAALPNTHSADSSIWNWVPRNGAAPPTVPAAPPAARKKAPAPAAPPTEYSSEEEEDAGGFNWLA